MSSEAPRVPETADAGTGHEPTDGAARAEPKKKKDKKELGSDRGIETMFRTSYQMHVEMSGLADSKSNILISINGLIISVLLAAISPRIGSNPWLLLPTAVVLLSCLVSMSFSILAARPRMLSENNARGQKPGTVANLMFFGSFVSLSLPEYEKAVLELMGARDELYRTMIRDIYGLGKVLDRKFALLRKAYTIFLAGLIFGVLLYLVVFAATVVLEPGGSLL